MLLNWFELLASFEGAGEGEGDGAGAPPAGAPPAAGDAGKTFTQAEVNKFLADDRRRHQEKYSSLESSYQELLSNQNLGQEERGQLEQQLEDLQARHRTKEQQLAYEKKQAEEKFGSEISEWQEKAKTWESRYTESTINRELQAAAVEHDAYNPRQIVVQLKGQTELTEEMDVNGKPTGKLVPMVKMTVKNEDTGAQESLQMTPSEAVEYMKKNPEQWGNFFKNNIREGIGSASGTGTMTGDGTVDVTKITDDQYYKLRKENPAALGLNHLRK